MLRKIVLTEFGETLLSSSSTEVRKKLDIELDLVAGVHKICKGWMDVMSVSDTHNALICRRCKLRVVIPNHIRSWKQLSTHMKNKLKEGEER